MAKKKEIVRHGSVEAGFMCCGLAEYEGLNTGTGFTPEGVIRTIAEDGFYGASALDREGDGFCQVVMTQAIYKDHRGVRPPTKEGTKRLADVVAYIKKHKLGSVAVTAVRTNPNSGNPVKGALFSPSVAGMTRWMKDHGIPPKESYRSRYDYW